MRELCCVTHSYLDIKLIEAVCSLFIRHLPVLHYIVCFCIQNQLLCLVLLSYNRCLSCVTKTFIDKMWGLGENGCRISGGHRPCTPCGWSSSQLGLRPSFSSSSHLSPSRSCGTCGGGRPLIHYSVVIGNQWQEPCHPFFGGGLGRTSVAAIASAAAAGLAV